MIVIGECTYKDEEELLEAFRDLLKPKSESSFTEYLNTDCIHFSKIMEWLHKNKFIVREFPDVIQRKVSLQSFGADTIKNYILKENPMLLKAPWRERRDAIDSLTIERMYDDPAFNVSPEIDALMKNIALGTGSFPSQSKESKLLMLNNCVENLLKNGKIYKEIHSSIFYDFLDEANVTKFRKDTQVFRHHSKESIVEREQWSDNKKVFYIRLGIIIITEVFQQTQ